MDEDKKNLYNVIPVNNSYIIHRKRILWLASFFYTCFLAAIFLTVRIPLNANNWPELTIFSLGLVPFIYIFTGKFVKFSGFTNKKWYSMILTTVFFDIPIIYPYRRIRKIYLDKIHELYIGDNGFLITFDGDDLDVFLSFDQFERVRDIEYFKNIIKDKSDAKISRIKTILKVPKLFSIFEIITIVVSILSISLVLLV